MNCNGFESSVILDYSCSYNRKLLNQGWMYVSSSKIYFHAFFLGAETKVTFELADIQELKKERSGVLFDSIKIVTTSNQEVD